MNSGLTEIAEEIQPKSRRPPQVKLPYFNNNRT
jgi:hypothetical protein